MGDSDWHEKDAATGYEREMMVEHIVVLLKRMKPNAPQEIIDKLPALAERLENALYRVSRSKTEYSNRFTLAERLRLVASGKSMVRIGKRQRPTSSSVSDSEEAAGKGLKKRAMAFHCQYEMATNMNNKVVFRFSNDNAPDTSVSTPRNNTRHPDVVRAYKLLDILTNPKMYPNVSRDDLIKDLHEINETSPAISAKLCEAMGHAINSQLHEARNSKIEYPPVVVDHAMDSESGPDADINADSLLSHTELGDPAFADRIDQEEDEEEPMSLILTFCAEHFSKSPINRNLLRSILRLFKGHSYVSVDGCVNLPRFDVKCLRRCVDRFALAEPECASIVVHHLLRSWPVTNSERQLVFIQQIESLFRVTNTQTSLLIIVPVIRRLAHCTNHGNCHVSQAALNLSENLVATAERLLQKMPNDAPSADIDRATEIRNILLYLQKMLKLNQNHWHPVIVRASEDFSRKLRLKLCGFSPQEMELDI